MWYVKHFDSAEEARAWVESLPVQWERIFVENKAYSIEYRPLRAV